MNCRLARITLAATAPDSVEGKLPEFDEAFAHVRACPECQAHLAAIRTPLHQPVQQPDQRPTQRPDHQLGVAIRSVPIPEGLKSRLKSRLFAELAGGLTVPVAEIGPAVLVGAPSVPFAEGQLPRVESVTGEPVTGEPVTGEPVTGEPVTLQVSELADHAAGHARVQRDSTGDSQKDLPDSKRVLTGRLISRRRMLAAISTAAMAIIGVGFWWFWDRQQPTDLTVNALLALCQELSESAGQRALDADHGGTAAKTDARTDAKADAKLIAFQGTFEPRLPYSEIQIPRSLLTQQGISLQAANVRVAQSSELQSGIMSQQMPSRDPVNHDPAKNNPASNGSARSAIASTEIGVMYRFSVRDAAGKSSSGVMVVVNLDRVDVRDLDVLANSFAAAEVYYPAPNLYATRIWRRDQQLYICYVESHQRNLLDSLMRQFYST